MSINNSVSEDEKQNLIISKCANSYDSQKYFIQILKNSISTPQDDKLKKLLTLLTTLIKDLGLPFAELMFEDKDIINFFYNKYLDNESPELYKNILLNLINIYNFKSTFPNYSDNLIQIFPNEKLDKRENLTKLEIFYNALSIIDGNISQMNENNCNDYVISLKEIDKLLNEMTNKKEYTLATIEFFKERYDTIEKKLQEKLSDFQSKNKETKYKSIFDNNVIFEQSKKLRNVPLKNRTFFYKNEILIEGEDEFIEFKNYFYPLDEEQEKEIKRQYCGFLNSKGGRIYIGIKDQKIATGLLLTYEERDKFRNLLVGYGNEFYPKCRLDNIKVYFIPIKSTKSYKFISNLYVVKIIIIPGDPYQLYSMTNKGYFCAKRLQGQSVNLTADEISKEIIDRALIKRKGELIINNEEFNDPKPDINSMIEGDTTVRKKKLSLKKGNLKKHAEYYVMISNIDKNLKVKDIHSQFNGCGCSKMDFPKEEGKSTGIGRLFFPNEEAAKEIINKFQGNDLGGDKKIKMSLKWRPLKKKKS